MPVRAEEELRLIRATAYTGGTVTASGIKPREGICSSCPEYLDDYVALIYQAIPTEDGYEPGELLWILECKDTGGKPIQKGYVIDIYRDDLERCQEVMNTVYENGAKGHVFVQYVRADG